MICGNRGLMYISLFTLIYCKRLNKKKVGSGEEGRISNLEEGRNLEEWGLRESMESL